MTGTYKVSSNTTDTGDAVKFGTVDINKITNTLNGQLDVDTPDINSPFTVRSGKLLQRNPANTFSYIVTNGAIVADRIVNEPVLTGDDTRVYESHPATLANKTLPTPIISSPSISGTIALADNTNITTDTTNGSKIATTSTQKLGFFGATPIVQPAANADTSGAVLADLETEVNQIKQLLRDLGLMAP